MLGMPKNYTRSSWGAHLRQSWGSPSCMLLPWGWMRMLLGMDSLAEWHSHPPPMWPDWLLGLDYRGFGWSLFLVPNRGISQVIGLTLLFTMGSNIWWTHSFRSGWGGVGWGLGQPCIGFSDCKCQPCSWRVVPLSLRVSLSLWEGGKGESMLNHMIIESTHH